MNKYIIRIMIAAALIAYVATLFSCRADMSYDEDMKVYNDFGEITYVGSNGYFEITRDDNARLRVMEYSGTSTAKVGKRVYFKYSILTDWDEASLDEKTYKIKVIIFNNIVAPPIVKESFLAEKEPFRSDSLGHDPVRIYEAVFSGNYVNIKFEYFRYAGSQKPHMINLLWDDTRNPNDSVYLQLRHNAMGEVAGMGTDIVSDTGLASFKLSDLVPEGKEGIDIKLRFNLDRKDGVGEYIEVDKSYTGTFKTYAKTKTYIAGNELSPPANTTAFLEQ